MTETLTIKNFGGIKFLEIEIKPITVLIGPQASGKSICAKLLFYFRHFNRHIVDFIVSRKAIEQLVPNYCQTFREYFPASSWGNEAFEITYRTTKDFLKVTRSSQDKQAINLNYGDFHRETIAIQNRSYQIVAKAIDSIQNSPLESWESERLAPQTLINTLGSHSEGRIPINQIFIPASRSIFSILQENYFSLLIDNQSFDPLIQRFGAFYERIKRFRGTFYEVFSESNDLAHASIKELIDEILSSKYIQEDNLDFLVHKDKRKVRISEASSGQQETLPLVLTLAALVGSKTSFNQKNSIYIEEPEAHVFPSTQKKIVELIATAFKYRESQSDFFITTHSPYILTAINNLLQAGELYSKAINRPDIIEKANKIVPAFKALNHDEIAVYSLDNAQCLSILDPETGLISASQIDEVSDEIGSEFDSVLDLLSEEFYAKAG
ncbi:AAA family ATPase [Leptothoe kymatousa]|uniref:AAA family ATPase n=1 Tax=Leptothoe kymatousa TAU-MAC 1615 TaxID=2364775 RepID=A0ABS5Y1H8_9CYAN|nr:AAA family ATPase [Leptothoe kymatousa]MBT9310855.1 AAA family ATPase [Leptothoe kymatousa TAU-MAC 1615]